MNRPQLQTQLDTVEFPPTRTPFSITTLQELVGQFPRYQEEYWNSQLQGRELHAPANACK